MSHDRLLAIAGCWAGEDVSHVELIGADYVTYTAATVDWLGSMQAKHLVPVVIDAWSPAAVLVAHTQWNIQVAPLRARRVKVVVASSGAEIRSHWGRGRVWFGSTEPGSEQCPVGSGRACPVWGIDGHKTHRGRSGVDDGRRKAVVL